MSTFDIYRDSTTNQFKGMSERMVALVKAVYDYADEHYNDGGWDVLAECWEPPDVAERLREDMTVEEAVDSWRPAVDVWADRQADASNSAF